MASVKVLWHTHLHRRPGALRDCLAGSECCGADVGLMVWRARCHEAYSLTRRAHELGVGITSLLTPP